MEELIVDEEDVLDEVRVFPNPISRYTQLYSLATLTKTAVLAQVTFSLSDGRQFLVSITKLDD